MSQLIRIGQITGGFGIRGQVKVEPMTDFPERFRKGMRLRLRNEWVRIESSSLHKGRFLLKLEGIDSLTEAEKLQWEYLEIPADDRPELEEDEFLTQDLIGLKVVTDDGRELGSVDEVLPYPAHDVLVVGELMIPMVKAFIRRIDLETAEIEVHLIPGMTGEGEDDVDVP